jgi:Flp pilus assembly protein TadG
MRRFLNLKRFLCDDKGLSAIEFAFIAPILVTLAVGTTEAGLVTYRYYDMDAAIGSGAQYIMRGGSDTSVARAIVASGWTSQSKGATINVDQYCRCGAKVTPCSNLCPDLSTPHGYVTIGAAENYDGLFMSKALTASETIRVR